MTVYKMAAAAFFLAGLCLSGTNAFARPPTVTVSPGYDRALQESRKQYQLRYQQSVTQPVQSTSPPAKRPKKTR